MSRGVNNLFWLVLMPVLLKALINVWLNCIELFLVKYYTEVDNGGAYCSGQVSWAMDVPFLWAKLWAPMAADLSCS